MNLDALNKWLTLLGNFGVIGGLVLIAMQMNFTAETIRLQNDIDLNKGIAAGEIAIMGDSAASAFATAVLRPAELSDIELQQLWAYLHNVMLSAQNNWLAYQDGLASERSWYFARRQAASFVSFPAGLIWWEHDRFEYEPAFTEQIDAQLALTGPIDIKDIMQSMLEEIRAIDTGHNRPSGAQQNCYSSHSPTFGALSACNSRLREASVGTECAHNRTM